MSDKFDEMARECIRKWYDDVNVTACVPYIEELQLVSLIADLVRRADEQARAEEREACKRALESVARYEANGDLDGILEPSADGFWISFGDAIAAIRARGEANEAKEGR